MGFFDALTKTLNNAGDAVKKTAIANTKKNWEQMDGLSTARIISIYNEKGADNAVGFLALLTLAKKKKLYEISLTEEDKENVERKCSSTNKMLEFEEDRESNDIRDAISTLKRDLPTYF